MADRDLTKRAARGIENPDAFREACAVFGDAGALSRLRLFREDLARHLDRIEADEMDLRSLRDMAHQTAGRAGLLGFPALADASARLDEAIRANTGIPDVLHHWTIQARLAVQTGAQVDHHDTPEDP